MTSKSHPQCPKCASNEHVVQLVQIIKDEERGLDANGDVAWVNEGKSREEIGWGWECQQCVHEWDLEGSLAPNKRPQLTKEDWAEIYCVLEFRLNEIEDKGVPQWAEHLSVIMEKIGPDGHLMMG